MTLAPKPAFAASVIFCGILSMLVTDSLLAQRNQRDNQRNQRDNQRLTNNILTLLADENVRRELELVDDQISELDEIQDSANQATRDVFSEMQDLPREDRREAFGNIREKIAERLTEFEEEIEDVLLPHQMTRLRQLKYRTPNNRRGGQNNSFGALGNEELLDELGLSDDQKEELEEAMEEAREELAEKQKKWAQDAEEEVLKVLTKKQRDKYRELVGEPFEFEDPRDAWNRRQRDREGNDGDRGQRDNRGNRGRGNRGRGDR